MKSLQRDGKQVDDVSGQAKKKAVAAMPRRERSGDPSGAPGSRCPAGVLSTKSFDAVAIDCIADTAGVAHDSRSTISAASAGFISRAWREVGLELGQVHAVEGDGQRRRAPSRATRPHATCAT